MIYISLLLLFSVAIVELIHCKRQHDIIKLLEEEKAALIKELAKTIELLKAKP